MKTTLLVFLSLASFSTAQLKTHFGDAPVSKPALDLCERVKKTYQSSGVAAAVKLLDTEGKAFIKSSSATDRIDFFSNLKAEALYWGGRDDLAWGTAAAEWIYRYGRFEGDNYIYRNIVPELYKLYFVGGRYAEARGVLTYEANRLAEGRDTECEVSRFQAKDFILKDFPEFKQRVLPSGLSQSRDALFMSSMAVQDLAEGKWRRALEESNISKNYGTQTLKWYASRKNLVDAEMVISELTDLWRTGSDVQTDVYHFLGIQELELAEYDRIIDFKVEKGMDLHHVDMAQCRALHLRYVLGSGDKSVVNQLTAIGEKLDKDDRAKADDKKKVSLLIADIHFLDQQPEKGWAIIDAQRKDASASEELKFMATKDWCRQRVNLNQLDEVESQLIRLLKNAREGGVKRYEIDLYQIYARFLIASGRLNDALRIQNELLRLLRSFDLYPRLPEALYDLARIQSLMGQPTLAEATLKAAREVLDGKKVPDGFARRIGKLLTPPLPGPARPDTSVPLAGIDIQPRRAMMIPLKDLPARGLFSLTNTSGEAKSGNLILTGPGLSAVEDPSTGQLSIEVAHDSGQPVITRPLTLAAGNAMVVDLSLAAAKMGTGAKVNLTWEPQKGTAQSAEWQADTAEDGITAAVTDASEYLENPFYLIPIYHLLQYQDDFEQALDVRVIASQPTRIELYNQEDALVMVDATGDGELNAKGDLVTLDFNHNMLPDLRLVAGTKELRFRLFVQPLQVIPPDGLVLELQLRQAGKWVTCSTDRLLPAAPGKSGAK